MLGVCYFYRNGVKQNYTQSVIWLYKAAMNNDPIACYELARIYEEGIALMIHKGWGKEWHEKAKEKLAEMTRTKSR